MLKDWYHNIKQYFIQLNLKKDNRPVIFAISLMIASILWLVNALGDRYETTVSMPVQYTNLPANKVLVQAPPSSVKVKMEASGFTLLRHKIKLTITPVNFNVKQFTNNMMGKSEASSFNVISDRYIDQISKQVSSEINILDLSPDTLTFVFDQVVSQKKPVKHQFHLDFENQFFLRDSIRFIPDSVLVSGPKSRVDTLTHVNAKHQRFRLLNSTVKRNVSIDPIEALEISPRRVVVEIPVSLYTEYIANVPVSQLNVPDSLNLVTFPGQVQIKCIVAFDQYENLTASSFMPGVDFADTKNSIDKLPVSILRAPNYVKSLSFHPQEVEYIIESNND